MKLTVEQYAQRKGISKTAVYNQIKHGKLAADFVTKENGITYIDEKALQDAAELPEEEKKKQDYVSLLLEQNKEYREQIAAQREELKELRATQQAQHTKMLELMEKQIAIQSNFQYIIARLQLPDAPTAENQPEVETVEKTVETVEKEVETDAGAGTPKKRSFWRLFRKK